VRRRSNNYKLDMDVQISSKIDLRDAEQRLHLIKAVLNSGLYAESALSHFRIGLEIFISDSGVKGPLIAYPPGILNLETGHNKSSGISIRELSDLAINLSLLKDCQNFCELLNGFSNSPQIMDTIFEVHIAAWCLGLESTIDLEFSPKCLVKQREKRPDFVFYTSEEVVYCECKNLHLESHKATKRFNKIFETYIEALNLYPIPNELRLDVRIDTPIRGDLKNQVQKVVLSALEAGRDKIFEVRKSDSFSYKIGLREESPPFSEYNMAQMQVTIGTTATKISWENAQFRLVFQDHKLIKSIGDTMSDAKNQLPKSALAVIFVQVFHSHSNIAKRACEVRLTDSAYEHIVAFGILGDGFQFHFREKSRQRIQKFFPI